MPINENKTLKVSSISGHFGRKGLKAVDLIVERDQDKIGKILIYFYPNIHT